MNETFKKVRTDLAIELIESLDSDIKLKSHENNYVKVTSVNVDKKMSKDIGKKPGIYITIDFEDISDFSNRENVGKALTEEIKKLLKVRKIKEDAECLIIGLGNEASTPDSLGPSTIENVLVTRHLFEISDNIKKGIRKVSAINPGVMGETGIETSDIILNVINGVKPNFIIVVDALAASSISRLTKTIQITDTGIHPGSGIGNKRKEISEETVGIPVFSIGVPTVVDAVTIVGDTINYLIKHISYLKNNLDKSKLSFKQKAIDEDNLTLEEKKELVGILGNLSDEDKRMLLEEVLTTVDYNYIVTPTGIDFLIQKLSEIIAGSINNAIHSSVTHY